MGGLHHFNPRFAKHAQCDVCSELKALQRAAKDPKEKVRLALLLVEHQDAQQRDRHCYYKARELGRRGLVLCVMQDGSDQERYRVIRVCRSPKELEESGPCPRLKLVGTLIHGVVGCFNVLEEDMPRDAQTTVELLFTSIEEARRELESKGKSLPPELWLQLDNTPAENKNQTVFSAVAALVAKGVFESASIAFLRKGHTHEDLDGLWGVNSSELDHVTTWDHPGDILAHTQRVMSRTLGHVKATTRKLDFIRSWNSWREGLGVTGFPGITGKGSPHWYHFSLRNSLPNALLPRVAPEARAGSPNDVMLEVKEFMADSDLSQDIIVAVPAEKASLIPVAPHTVVPRHVICSKLRGKLATFCTRLLRHFPDKTAAAAYIREWMDRADTSGLNRPLELRFLAGASAGGVGSARCVATEVAQQCAYPVKVVSVTRSEERAARRGSTRERASGLPPLPFAEYVAQRVAQGALEETARKEWNGLVIIGSAGT